jgi:hypothetical protein
VTVGVRWQVLGEIADEVFPMDDATAKKVAAFDGESLIGFQFASIHKRWIEYLSDIKVKS